MPKPYDATLKTMFEISPDDWPWLFQRSARAVRVIDSDISTVTGAADKVLRVSGNPDWIHHLEFQAGPDQSKPRMLNIYNSVLEGRHRLKVRTGLVLLRPQANLRSITGRYECRFPEDAEPYRIFCYDVIRVWELPVERFLSGGIGLLPLAPISRVEKSDLPRVITEMKKRLAKSPSSDAKQIWASTYVLLGLRYEAALPQQLLQEVMGMKESTTYQAIIAEGRQEGRQEGALQEALKLVLRLGERRFGVAADKRASAALKSMEKLDELEAIMERALIAESWEELLGERLKRPSRKSGK